MYYEDITYMIMILFLLFLSYMTSGWLLCRHYVIITECIHQTFVTHIFCDTCDFALGMVHKERWRPAKNKPLERKTLLRSAARTRAHTRAAATRIRGRQNVPYLNGDEGSRDSNSQASPTHNHNHVPKLFPLINMYTDNFSKRTTVKETRLRFTRWQSPWRCEGSALPSTCSQYCRNERTSQRYYNNGLF